VPDDVPRWFVEDFLTWGERPDGDAWQANWDDPTRPLGGFDWWSMGYLVHAHEVTRARAIWNAVKGELLPRWRREHPGTRPWGWWQWDSPEPRRLVDAGQVESEAGYLARLDLLTHPERRRLTSEDFEPEPLAVAALVEEDSAALLGDPLG
jgi:hypothetical protein